MSELPALPVYGFAPNLSGLLSLAATVLLPIVVGLVTRQSTSASVKAVLLLALAGVKTVLEAWILAASSGVTFEWVPVVYSTVVSFGVAVAVHYGLFKPVGATGAAQRSLIADRPPASPPFFRG